MWSTQEMLIPTRHHHTGCHLLCIKKYSSTVELVQCNHHWSSLIVMANKKMAHIDFALTIRNWTKTPKPTHFLYLRLTASLISWQTHATFLHWIWPQARLLADSNAPNSQETTAFLTPQRLYEFRMMPFGHTNAPVALQRLMQRALMRLNPAGWTEFVAVYIYDVLLFSQSGRTLPPLKTGHWETPSRTQIEAYQVSLC